MVAFNVFLCVWDPPLPCKQKFLGHPMYQWTNNKPMQKYVLFSIVYVRHMPGYVTLITSCLASTFTGDSVAGSMVTTPPKMPSGKTQFYLSNSWVAS